MFLSSASNIHDIFLEMKINTKKFKKKEEDLPT